jgi:methionyl aminopeptidase
VGDISSFIEHGLRKHGYSAVRVLTGHGLGDNLHQFPDVPNVGKAGTGPMLPANTMIAIEPIAVMGSPEVFTDVDQWTVLTKDSSLACHFEHSVLILEGGCEIIA